MSLDTELKFGGDEPIQHNEFSLTLMLSYPLLVTQLDMPSFISTGTSVFKEGSSSGGRGHFIGIEPITSAEVSHFDSAQHERLIGL